MPLETQGVERGGGTVEGPGGETWRRRSSSSGMWQRSAWPGSTSASGGSSLLAHGAELARAPRVEDAARRRVGCARNLALEADAGALVAVERGHGREQRLRIGVMRGREDGCGLAELHDAAEVEDGDPVGQVADDAEVVGDEEVGDALLFLEVDEEVEDRRLHGDVEGRGRLVADDNARLAGERARDGDPLLEAARELGGPRG